MTPSKIDADLVNAMSVLHAASAESPAVTIEDSGLFGEDAIALVLPARARTRLDSAAAMAEALHAVDRRLETLLTRVGMESAARDPIRRAFLAGLPDIAAALKLDAEALLAGDPAAGSLDEVVLSYPGCYATATYRLAHALFHLQVPLLPRLMSEYAHRLVGIDINPGATIGRSFFIDHGTSVVIGETAIIGDNVKIYQGVTLGALSVARDARDTKRHPTIGDNVVIYANATILGGDTVIGEGSVIGGNVWLTKSVPPGSRVMYRGTELQENKEETS